MKSAVPYDDPIGYSVSEFRGTMRISYVHEFIVLAEKLSFTAAANELHVSQSALSKHIAALEADLNTQLLNRNKHLVVLTSQGEQFLDAARIIDRTFQRAKQSLQQQARNDSMLMVGGLVDSPGEFSVLSRAVQIMQQQDPSRMVHFVPVTTMSVRTQIVDDVIDCAFTSYDYASAPDQEKDMFEYTVIGKMPFTAIMLKSHPLAQRSALHVQDLEGQTLVQLSGPRSHSGWNRIHSWLSRHGVNAETQPYNVFSLNDYINVDLEGSIFILPTIEMRKGELHDPVRTVVPFDDPDAFFPFGVLRLKNSRKAAAIETLAEATRKVIASDSECDLQLT